MLKNNFLKISLLSLLVSSSLYAQKIEIRELNQPSTGVKGIRNNGDAILSKFLYQYDNNEISPMPTELETLSKLNQKGDIIGIKKVDGILRPAYKLATSSVWEVGPVYDDFTAEDGLAMWAISENGRYIVGQMKNMPFIYDLEEKKLTNLTPKGYTYGAGYSVNDEGTTVGWLDTNTNGTFRELAIMKNDLSSKIILSDIAIPVNNHIWHISNNGILVGDVANKPFMYNMHTDEYKIFDLPAGFRSGAFLSSNGEIFVGYVQNTVMDRDAIIYHPSFGNQPRLLKDLLVEQGVQITIPGGKMGTAGTISENGDFIGGNEVGNGNLAAGWIVKLNGYFESRNCIVKVPSDIQVQLKFGEKSAIVNYDVTSDCNDGELKIVKGLPSGSEFPVGITTVVYNYEDKEGKLIATGSFKVHVKDAYCTPKFSSIVEPITLVKLGTIENSTSPYIDANENEYFLEQSTDLELGKTYEITVAGNTNGVEDSSEFVAFFDFNQDGVFTPENEGFYIGKVTGSTGIDGKSVTKSITIPDNVKTGVTRMRIMKTYRIVPEDPCSIVYQYGQSEDYTVNFTSNLNTTDINSKSIKIYPNPVGDDLFIQSDVTIHSIKIMSLEGKSVRLFEVNQANPKVNVSSLSKGVYILQLSTDKGLINQKMIKK